MRGSAPAVPGQWNAFRVGRSYTAREDLSAGGLFEVDDRVELEHSLEMDAELTQAAAEEMRVPASRIYSHFQDCICFLKEYCNFYRKMKFSPP